MAEHHIGGPGGVAVRAHIGGADDEVVKAIAVYVTRGTDRGDALVQAGHLQAIDPSQAGKLEIGGNSGGRSVNDIDGPGTVWSAARGELGAGEQVGNPVSIEVASGHGPSSKAGGRLSIHPEAVGAIQTGEIEQGRGGERPAEDDIGLPGHLAMGCTARTPDGQVGETVSVDVSGRGYGKAAAVDAEAVGSIESGDVKIRRSA